MTLSIHLREEASELLEHERIELQWGEALLAPEVDMPLVLDLTSKIMNYCKAHQLDFETHELKVYESPEVENSLEAKIFRVARFGFEAYTLPSAIFSYWERAAYQKKIRETLDDDSTGNLHPVGVSSVKEGLTEEHVDQLFAVLFKNGLNCQRWDSEKVMRYMARSEYSLKFLSRMLSEGLNPRLKLKDGHELLLGICLREVRLEAIQMLIDAGASVLAKGIEGNTALMLICRRYDGSFEMAELLINAGNRLNVQDEKGLTALHYATARGKEKVIALLLKHQARCDLLDHRGRTPGHYAAISGVHFSDKEQSLSCMIQLVNAGVKINAKDHSGNTALHLAAGKGEMEMVKKLIELGARADLRNKSSKTPADLAKSQGHAEVGMLLEQIERAQNEKHLLSQIGRGVQLAATTKPRRGHRL